MIPGELRRARTWQLRENPHDQVFKSSIWIVGRKLTRPYVFRRRWTSTIEERGILSESLCFLAFWAESGDQRKPRIYTMTNRTSTYRVMCVKAVGDAGILERLVFFLFLDFLQYYRLLNFTCNNRDVLLHWCEPCWFQRSHVEEWVLCSLLCSFFFLWKFFFAGRKLLCSFLAEWSWAYLVASLWALLSLLFSIHFYHVAVVSKSDEYTFFFPEKRKIKQNAISLVSN